MPTLTKTTGEEILEQIASELDVPDSRYESAERSYLSINKWLERSDSTLVHLRPQMYPQGSFRLGTVTKPADDDEHYDLDIVCEMNTSKSEVSQEDLKKMLGAEIAAYAERHGMADPGESRRCWTLDYADSAQFHMDLLPALPDGSRQQRLLMDIAPGFSAGAATAIAITDRDHPHYRTKNEEWPSSNPKGYGAWFVARMQPTSGGTRGVLALDKAERIPDYKIRTPLQQAIKIMKRHRDMMFSDRLDERPISVILTTLAALSYACEPTISGALLSILKSMHTHVEDRNGVAWVANPTDPRENFADRWLQFPERREAFYEWLDQARRDFSAAAAATDASHAMDVLAKNVGAEVIDAAAQRSAARRSGPSHNAGILGTVGSALRSARSTILSAAHRKNPPWPILKDPTESVRIFEARCSVNGFRARAFASNCAALPKNADLTFKAVTSARRPYKVAWQVTNTGAEATSVRGLRGDFEDGALEASGLTKKENTLYAGSHGIECFVIKGDIVVGRSGVFVVNIR